MTIKRMVKVSLFLLVGLLLWDVGASFLLDHGSRNRLYTDASKIPYRRVGLVLGCSEKLGDGQLNPFFENRIRAAVSLYKARKVERFLVSGDHHTARYDEPTAMKNHLMAAGVPADRIVCDYAGFHTLDSMIRAKKVFGQSRITVISQRFHNERAIFLARRQGMDAIGFDAEDVGGYNSFPTHCREQGSKMFTLLDVYVLRSRPKFLGPRVEI